MKTQPSTKIDLYDWQWEQIMSACIVAAERPEELTDEEREHLRMTYFTIKNYIH